MMVAALPSSLLATYRPVLTHLPLLLLLLLLLLIQSVTTRIIIQQLTIIIFHCQSSAAADDGNGRKEELPYNVKGESEGRTHIDDVRQHQRRSDYYTFSAVQTNVTA